MTPTTKDRTDKQGQRKQIIAWGIACAVSFGFYYLELGSVITYLIPIPILIIVFMTTKAYIRFQGSVGIERIKPICIALFAVWWHIPRLFWIFPIGEVQMRMIGTGCQSIILLLIVTLSIIYLIATRKRQTKKYPSVICSIVALALWFLWNLETL